MSLQGEDYTYDVYRWNLWTWALDLIQDPTLEPHFVWDAVQLSKWNGEAFEKFIDEPWTAQAFWDLQVCFRTSFEGHRAYWSTYIDEAPKRSEGPLLYYIC